MKKVNVNKNCDMKACNIRVHDMVIILGMKCVVTECITSDKCFVKWDGKLDSHVFTFRQLDIMLANGMEVWREVEPKKIELNCTTTINSWGICIGNGRDTLRDVLNNAGFSRYEKVKVTIEEVLD